MASAAPSELPPVDSRKGSIFRPQHEPQAPIIGPTMHPSRASTKTPAQMLDEMMRSPFFVTPDAAASAAADPAANDELEAFRALRREGTPLELARSCRESGNELFKGKGWAGAKGFYTQGLDALRGKGVSEKEDGEEGEEDPKGSEEEKARLREVLLVNRAACDLELKNYRMVITDCAAVLSTNPHHQKAIYRSARALQSLARPSEALSLVDTALAQDPEDVSLRSLQVSLQKALFRTEAAAQKRAAEDETRLAHRQALLQAIRMRGWRVILPDGMNGVVDPNLPAFELSEPLDPTSTVVLPLQLEYPLAGPPPVTELIRRCSELDTLGEQLAVVLDPGDRPGWDSRGEYVAGKVSCFLETKGRDGRPGLVRAGMKTRVGDLMAKGNEEEKDAEGEKGRGKGRVEVRGGMLRVLVLPRAKADGWVKEFGERIGALGGRLDR